MLNKIYFFLKILENNKKYLIFILNNKIHFYTIKNL